ncbi:MAG TPA: hemerythrin domain-containing protein [Blastocatellia bacterium]|nr:hemerythrin domain-containing protein [Blastocatellia bacterium]
MSQPFHILKHEHRVIERVLRSLDGVCARLQGGIVVPAPTLLEIADFITIFADGYHHGKEEKHLFPALERRGITREGGPLGMMEYEHRVERELIADLRQAIYFYRDGDEPAAHRFVEAAQAFLRLLVGHIEKEDSILFRIGDEVLDDDEKSALVESFKQADTALGGLTLQDYERMASELEDKWAL